jgi:tRNA pseudouridine38-40 synthase
MRNIKLTIEYDGTAYAGWQKQDNAVAIQEVVTKSIERVVGESCNIVGVGRTDAGVHALGYVVNFKSFTNIPLDGLVQAFNSTLPNDIAVKGAEEVAIGFDARRDAKNKLYRYVVMTQDIRSPLMRCRAWLVTWPLDVEAMKRATNVFIGKHDFTSFVSTRTNAENMVREMLSFTVKDKGEGIIEFEVRGVGFLKYMVRNMIGALVTLGRGRVTEDDLRTIMDARDRTKAPVTAPPEGLFFVEAEY